ncbi:hypothetical protein, partial [Asticcacaulis biprosthecium]|uniref:hypothetical protein n=1 Tax=Asticcacaulis biprosthecium TaxID=76891 RepID=UPI00058B9A1F
MAYRNPALILGGLLSLGAALMHLAIVVSGPEAYLFFGAGDAMATMAARGDPQAATITVGIAAVLTVWALYAFSVATGKFHLPLRWPGLIAVTAIYL